MSTCMPVLFSYPMLYVLHTILFILRSICFLLHIIIYSLDIALCTRILYIMTSCSVNKIISKALGRKEPSARSKMQGAQFSIKKCTDFLMSAIMCVNLIFTKVYKLKIIFIGIINFDFLALLDDKQTVSLSVGKSLSFFGGVRNSLL